MCAQGHLKTGRPQRTVVMVDSRIILFMRKPFTTVGQIKNALQEAGEYVSQSPMKTQLQTDFSLIHSGSLLSCPICLIFIGVTTFVELQKDNIMIIITDRVEDPSCIKPFSFKHLFCPSGSRTG